MNWLSLLGLDEVVARWRHAAKEGASAVEDRLELACLEWRDECHRLALVLILALAVMGLTVVALTVLSLAFIVHFWDSPQRTLVAWLVALLWLLCLAGTVFALTRVMRRGSTAFSLTRRELARDWQDLKETL